MNRIKRIADSVLERYPKLFTEDYEQNKKLLDTVALISSKQLRNQVAGYITKRIKQGINMKEERKES